MLECITGHNSLNRNLEFVADSGLYSIKDNYHNNKNTIRHEQDSDTYMAHEFNNNLVLSTSSGNSEDEEVTISHPGYYTAAQRATTTIS